MASMNFDRTKDRMRGDEVDTELGDEIEWKRWEGVEVEREDEREENK